jgi:hypothetical protein
MPNWVKASKKILIQAKKIKQTIDFQQKNFRNDEMGY